MKQTKKLSALFLAVVMMCCAFSFNVLAAAPIKLIIDGQTIQSNVAPVVENDTTLVPIRVITETLGATVSWQESKKQATITTAAYTVIFMLDSKNYTVNGVAKQLSVPAKSIDGSTMVPIRALAEAIGAEVNYDVKTNSATVNYFSTMKGSIKVSGSTTVQPIMQAAADKLIAMNKGLSITVAGGGSGAGIKDTQSGANNIGMSSRTLTADESATLNPFIMANDGIAIIVNPKNTVTNLTKAQAEKIFLGEIKNWKEVGGKDAPIFVQTRETGSGTLATLEEMLLEKKNLVETATPFTSSALIKQAVAKDENAIGFDSIGFVDSTVKAVSLDNVTPSLKTVQDGTYAMSRSLYVFTKGAPTGANAMLIDYLRSAFCQENIVSKEGYVPFR